jgi:hypothetical protein
MYRAISHQKPSPYKLLHVIFYVLLLCSISSVVTAKNIDDTPCGKGHELSTECIEYTSHLNAEGLYLVSTQMYWQYVGRLQPDNMDKITVLRRQLMDKSAEQGHVPAIVYKAHAYKNSGQLNMAEEYFRKAESHGGKTYSNDIHQIQQARYLRLISTVVMVCVLAILNVQLILKRNWERLRRRTLILTPYYVIFVFSAWYLSAGASGRLVHPLLSRAFYWLDIQFLFFASPFIVAAAYYRLISKRSISKQLAVLNLSVLASAYVGIVILGYALAPLASQGAGK